MASGAVLAGYWMIAAVLNGGHWSGASEAARQTLDTMKAFHSRFPPGSTVLVDAPDTYQGAYVFRNGLSEAAELVGLRRDLHWRRGTAALLGPGAGRDLGVRVFEIGADRDWTACERALFTLPGPGTPLSLMPASAQSWVSIPMTIAEAECHSVTLSTSCGENTGTLFWKTTDAAPFTTMRSRDLKLSGEPLPVRLSSLGASSKLWLRIDLDRPMVAACWGPVELRRCPASCDLAPVGSR